MILSGTLFVVLVMIGFETVGFFAASLGGMAQKKREGGQTDTPGRRGSLDPLGAEPGPPL